MSISPSPTSSLFIIHILLLLLSISSTSSLKELLFKDVEELTVDNLGLFYHSSNITQLQYILLVDQVEMEYNKINSNRPSNERIDILFYGCDGDVEQNMAMFEEAEFINNEIYIYTQFNKSGIDRFNHILEVPYVIKYLHSLTDTLPSPSLVSEIINEDKFLSLTSNKPIFVMFYIPTCTHCRDYKEQFERYAYQFKEVAQFMKLNCFGLSNFCKRANIGKYPSFKLYKNKQYISLIGERNIFALERFFNEYTSGKLVFEDIISLKNQDVEVEEEEEMDDENVMINDSIPPLAEEFSLDFDEKIIPNNDEINTDLIAERAFSELSTDPQEKLTMFYKTNSPNLKEYMRQYERAVHILSQLFPYLVFYKCNGDLPVNKEEFTKAGFKNEVILFTALRHVKFNSEITISNIVKTVRFRMIEKKLDSVLQFTNEVALFDKIDSTAKPAIINFFSDTCSDCKPFNPQYGNLATLYGSKIDFYAVDCTEYKGNRDFCINSNVIGYPTLIYYSGEIKIKYTGDRDAISLINFVDRLLGKKVKVSGDEDNINEDEKSLYTKFSKIDDKLKKLLFEENKRLKSKLEELEYAVIIKENVELEIKIKNLRRLLNDEF